LYALLAITLITLFVFAIQQFINNFKTDAKKALLSLGIIVLFVILFFATYAIGDGTPLTRLSLSDATVDYNVPFWLKYADMLLYSTYILFALAALAILVGSVKKVLNK
jgi:bacteriorhodopsin